MAIKTLSQAAYARHRGISPARVSVLIRDGKIPPSCYEIQTNGRRLINVAQADQALSENLDQIYNPRHTRSTFEQEKLGTQNKAADFAFLPDEDMTTAQPEWELRYIVKMLELDPGHLEIVKHNRRHYSIIVDDIDTEDLEPRPWSVEIKFSFGEN